MSRIDVIGNIAIAAVLTIGCAGNTAPVGSLPSPKEAARFPYGGWIELTITPDSSVDGELLAVTSDSVWVLAQGGGVVIPTAQVTAGKVTTYLAATGAVAGWTTLGVFSTASNGWFLFFTAPAWIITGIVAGNKESHAPERRVPPLAWPDLAAYARFPQGMPAGVSLDSLKARKTER